jgi:DNA-binding transcriptional LysR family regulator
MERSPHPGASAQIPDSLPFDLRALEIFLAVCDTGAMAAAARQLKMTQPAISQAIAELEARSGVVLFDRAVRPLGLTQAGWLLRQRASALMADALQIAPMLRETGQGKLPLLRVGLVDSLSRTLTLTLARFLMANVEQNAILFGLTALHASALMARRLDMILGVDELVDTDGLERWPLLEEPYVVLLPRHVAPADAVDLAALAAAAPLIRFSARSKTGAEIDAHLRRLRLDIPRRQEFDSPYAVTAAVAEGLGWAITTALCVIEAGMSMGEMRLVPLPGPALRRHLTLVAHKAELGSLPRQVSSLAVEALGAACERFFTQQDSWLRPQLVIGGAKRPR